MKGLLIKDFSLLKKQKIFFLIILIQGVAFFGFGEQANISFAVSFITFIMCFFTVSTISYDEYNHGNAFLFSLPFSRKTYTAEKYVFGLLLGGVTWLAVCAVSSAVVYIRFPDTFSLQELFTTYPLYLAMALCMEAVLIPFQLKFGGEKGRLALILFFVGLFLAGMLLIRVLKSCGIDLDAILTSFSMYGALTFALCILAFTAILFLLSLALSIRIVEKKDF